MWFTASRLLKCTYPDDLSTSELDYLYEESIILVEAGSDAEAEKRALEISRTYENEYTAGSGERVKWVFERVLRVSQIYEKELKEGVEVFSRFLDMEQVQALCRPRHMLE